MTFSSSSLCHLPLTSPSFKPISTSSLLLSPLNSSHSTLLNVNTCFFHTNTLQLYRLLKRESIFFQYLGILLTSNLSWSLHILTIRCKACKVLGIIYIDTSTNFFLQLLSYVSIHHSCMAHPWVQFPCLVSLLSFPFSLPGISTIFRPQTHLQIWHRSPLPPSTWVKTHPTLHLPSINTPYSYYLKSSAPTSTSLPLYFNAAPTLPILPPNNFQLSLSLPILLISEIFFPFNHPPMELPPTLP